MIETITLTPDHPRYAEITALLQAMPLAEQWWCDAESQHEDGVSYAMVLDDDVPAAWAGWEVRGGVLHCVSSYERRGHGRALGLYALAYAHRHREVVVDWTGPAVTYLYEQPIPLHEADGWRKSGAVEGVDYGTSDEPGVPPHRWWRLIRP